MADSAELAHEVAEYREVNALLAYGAAVRPSPKVKERLFQRIGGDPVIRLRPTRSRVMPLLSIGLAAAALLAVGLGRRVQSLTDELGRRNLRLAATEAQLAKRELTLNTLLLAESDLTVVQLTAVGAQAPGIQFYWNRRSNMAVLHAFRLPPTPKGKTYQFWLLRGRTR